MVTVGVEDDDLRHIDGLPVLYARNHEAMASRVATRRKLWRALEASQPSRGTDEQPENEQPVGDQVSKPRVG